MWTERERRRALPRTMIGALALLAATAAAATAASAGPTTSTASTTSRAAAPTTTATTPAAPAASVTPANAPAAVPAPTPAPRPPDALAPATSWLALIDGGRYAESWDGAAAAFQRGVSREQWVAALQQARAPLGAVIGGRTLATSTESDGVPGAPPGHYTVLQFHTSFANRPAIIEVVTAVLEKDGHWRVAGYYLR